jgi:hypothetical protein
MKRAWMQAALINFLILVAMAWYAAAETRVLGDWCWRLTPFADTIMARVYEAESVEGEPYIPLTLKLYWLGLNVYSLSGGGTGGINYSGDVLTLHAVVRQNNPGFPYFGGNPLTEFKAVVGLGTFTGHVSARSEGAIIYGRPAHEVGSQMQWIDCAEFEPPAQVSVQRSSVQGFSLAGAQP